MRILSKRARASIRGAGAVAVVLLGLSVGCGGQVAARESSHKGSTMLFSVTAAEVNRAVTLAEKAITSTARPTDYQLISAINLVAGSEYRGPAFWRLRFKRRDLIPADAEGVLGAGGELLVDVDVHTGVATLVGHGE